MQQVEKEEPGKHGVNRSVCPSAFISLSHIIYNMPVMFEPTNQTRGAGDGFYCLVVRKEPNKLILDVPGSYVLWDREQQASVPGGGVDKER